MAAPREDKHRRLSWITGGIRSGGSHGNRDWLRSAAGISCDGGGGGGGGMNGGLRAVFTPCLLSCHRRYIYVIILGRCDWEEASVWVSTLTLPRHCQHHVTITTIDGKKTDNTSISDDKNIDSRSPRRQEYTVYDFREICWTWVLTLMSRCSSCYCAVRLGGKRARYICVGSVH